MISGREVAARKIVSTSISGFELVIQELPSAFLAMLTQA
jgi:hypothetical protein